MYYIINWKYETMEENYFEVFTTKKARADYYGLYYKDIEKEFIVLELKTIQGYDLTNSTNGIELNCCQFH